MKIIAKHYKWFTTQYGFREKPIISLLRFIEWHLHCLFIRRPISIYFPSIGKEMILPPLARGTAKAYFIFRDLFNHKDIELMKKYLNQGDTFIDIGANIGFYTIMLSDSIGNNGHAFSFEPAKESFSYLKKNVERNNLSNVKAFEYAIADKETISNLWHHPDSSRYSLGETGSKLFEKVICKTLDQIILEEGINKVNLIKIDVEGFEELVLKGATKTIDSYKPIIIFENNPEAIKNAKLTFGGTIDLLFNLGYKVFRIDTHGVLSERIEKELFGDYISWIQD